MTKPLDLDNVASVKPRRPLKHQKTKITFFNVKEKTMTMTLVAFQTQTQNRSVLATQFPKLHHCPRW